MSPPSFGAAARILAERDPVIARLVAEAGPPRLSRPAESHFASLVRAIVYQQLAGRAAAFHQQFVQHLHASANSYAATEAANAVAAG